MLLLSALAFAGSQAVTIVLQGAQDKMSVQIERPGVANVLLADPGKGALEATLVGEPQRVMPIRLVATQDGNARIIYDGLVILTDADREVISFVYDPIHLARRVSAGPSALIDPALDARAGWWVGFGWSAVSLLYVSALGLMWATKTRAR